MRRNPPADMHTDRRHLLLRVFVPNPNSRLALNALCCNPEFQRGPDHHFFQHTHIPHHIAPDCAQIQYRVAHDLARAMIRNVPAPVRGMELHALLLQNVLGSEQVLSLPVPPLRDDVRVLAKQQNIFDCIGFPRRDQALLQRPRLRVAHQSEVDHLAVFHHSPVTSHQSRVTSHYTLICKPRTLANASPIASHTVGCACTMFIMSSMVPSRFNTVAASARISVASGPMM